MLMLTDNGEARDRDALSAGLHREHSLDVPTHGHQIPFAFDVFESAQQTLSISHHRCDDAEHRFGCLFAQRVELSAPRRLQPIRHLLQRGRRVGRGVERGGKALFSAHMMASASHRDQRFDLDRRATLDVGLTEIATVGEYPFGATQFLRQRLDLLDHRHQLFFVVGCLRDFGGHDEHAAGRHDRLGVVTLVKAATGDLHDARVFIRQIHLVLVLHATSGWSGRAAARLLAGALFLLGACSKFALMFGLVALQTLLCSRLDRRLRRGNGCQAQLAALQFLGNRHAVRDIHPVGLLGEPQQLLNFPLQLFLDLLRMPVRERTEFLDLQDSGTKFNQATTR